MAAGQSAWRVLVVDDEENLNWSLVNSLQKEGYLTEGAYTAEAALSRLNTSSYDCVISDVKMPGMDGFELMQWLRQHRPQTRVIMMTAFGSPTARQEALRHGVIAYMEKPFDLRSLKEELRRLASADAAGRADEEGYDLLEVARVLNLSRRDIAVNVQGGGFAGVLRFLRGELIYAEAGPLRGEQAFFAVCVPKGGQVQPMPWDGRTERNVTTPLSRLIYQALAERENQVAGPTTVLPPAPTPSAPAQPEPQDTAAPSNPATEQATPPQQAEASAQEIPGAVDQTRQTPSTATIALASVLAEVAATIASPCGVVVLRPDGSLLAQSWKDMQELSAAAYSHLAGSAQAASRALLLGDIGPMQEVAIRAGAYTLTIRRVAAADRAALLVAIVPSGADQSELAIALKARTPAIAEALR